ncbi:MAG: Uncharacterised protein [Flavobacteriaceae bacterium]|nr:MAG: Uncharacterised protein [Flavobacteriaceae bacterium]
MQFQGTLTKMKTEIGSPIQYYLVFERDFIHINQLLDKKISISFLGYECMNCKKEKKIYRQGFCYDCFFEIPQAADWIIHPEKSQAHLGIEDRNLDYEKAVQLKPHIVYLANSGNVKVGVTRKTQIPTRWIDQGAHKALEIAELPNRYLAGITEVALKNYVGDKTNWRTMLKNEIQEQDLCSWRDKLKQYIPKEALPYFIDNIKETTLEFPVLQYPTKLKTLNLVKTPHYSGTLKGVKGQYLIFEDDTVFNVRSNEGFVVSINML